MQEVSSGCGRRPKKSELAAEGGSMEAIMSSETLAITSSATLARMSPSATLA